MLYTIQRIMTKHASKSHSNTLFLSFFSDPSYGATGRLVQVDGKMVSYGVVNEREVRAVAGLMFAIGLATVFITFFTQNFLLAAVVVPVFLLEFLLKVFVGPQWSFFAVLVRPLISHLEPEWVGAIQKRFAWALGAAFATVVLVLLFVLGIRGPGVLLFCSICLVLMWLESAAGICLGCNMYGLLIKKGFIQPLVNGPKCAGGACKI